MSSGMADLHYTTPTTCFHRLAQLADLTEFQFDVIAAYEARKFGMPRNELRRLVGRIREMSPEERAAEYDALAKIES